MLASDASLGSRFTVLVLPTAWYWLIVVWYVSVLVHELGHLLMGWATGHRFYSFSVSIFVLHKASGKLKFSISPYGIFGGHCLMIPPENDTSLQDYEFVWYHIGGCLFNILLLIILIRLDGVFLYGDLRSSLVSMGISVQMAVLFWNLLPFIANDGQNLWRALNCKTAKRGLYLVLYMSGILMDGRRYSDLDGKLFYVSPTADLSDWRVAYVVVCEAAYLYDIGEYEKSIACYEKIEAHKHREYDIPIALDRLYYYTVHNPDHEKARTIFSDKKVNKAIKKYPRIMAAFEYFVNNDKETGKELLQKAKDQVKKLPEKGSQIMEMDYCTRLEEMFT